MITDLKKTFEDYLSTSITDDLWLTITFRNPRYDIGALKSLKHFFKNLNTPLLKFYRNSLRMWVFVEKNPSEPGFHTHLLVKNFDKNLVKPLEKKCASAFGNSLAQMGDCHTLGYLSDKYANDRLVHYDYWRINSKIR